MKGTPHFPPQKRGFELLSTATIELIAVVTVALIFDMMNGFHDGCNAVSTVIYTGALKPRFAIGLSAIFNFIGPLVMGVAVAKTIGGSSKRGDASAHLVAGRPLRGDRVGSAHLVVGAARQLVARTRGRPRRCRACRSRPIGHQLEQARSRLRRAVYFAVPWHHDRFIFMRVSRFFFAWSLGYGARRRFYKRMQILSSSWVSFSHGSNDATKVMGIITIFSGGRTGSERRRICSGPRGDIPLWVILSCAAAMGMGTFLSVKSFGSSARWGRRSPNCTRSTGSARKAEGRRSSSWLRCSGCPCPPHTSSLRRSPVQVWRANWAGSAGKSSVLSCWPGW